jgi:predicted RND superfamily exporter protein
MFRLLVKHRFLTLIGVLVVTALAASQLPKLRLDPNVEAYVPQHHPIRTFWTETEEMFQLGDEVLIAIVDDSEQGIFTPGTLKAIADISDEVEKLPFVLESELTSLSRAEAIEGGEDSLDVVRFYEDPPTTQAEADAVRDMLFRNPVFLDRLVSRNGHITVVRFKIDRDAVDLHDALGIFTEIAERYRAPNLRMLVTGSPMIEALYGRQTAVSSPPVGQGARAGTTAG